MLWLVVEQIKCVMYENILATETLETGADANALFCHLNWKCRGWNDSELIGGEDCFPLLMAWNQDDLPAAFYLPRNGKNETHFCSKPKDHFDEISPSQCSKATLTLSFKQWPWRQNKCRTGSLREKNQELHLHPQQLQKIDFDAAQTRTRTGADFVFTLLFLLSPLTHLHVKPTVQHFYEVLRRETEKRRRPPCAGNRPLQIKWINNILQ